MTDSTVDLPFGDAFGPGQLSVEDDEDELAVVLGLVAAYAGEPDDFDQAVADKFFADSPNPLERAENVRFALQTENGYGVVDSGFEFTDLGYELHSIRNDSESLYDRFATHILQNLYGQEVIETIRDLEALGEQTTESNIRRHLEDYYDIYLGEGSNHWSQMRAWLAKADLINTGIHLYEIDYNKIETLTGVSTEELSALENLTSEQRAFLWTLAIVNPDGPVENSRVRRAAEAGFGVMIDQSNITRQILNPLTELGYIEWEHADGAPNTVQTTAAFEQDVMIPALETVSQRVGIPCSALRTSFSKLATELTTPSDDDRSTRTGQTLTVKLASLLDLEFIGWRRTNEEHTTAVFDHAGQTLDRWLVTTVPFGAELTANTVYQTLGEAQALAAGTVLIVSRKGIRQDARRIANQIVQEEPITVLLVMVDEIAQFDSEPDRFRDAVESEVTRMRRVRKIGDEHRYAIDGQQQLKLQSLSALEKAIYPEMSAADRSLSDFGVE